MSKLFRKPILIGVFFLFLFNLLFFGLKNLQALAGLEERNHAIAEQFIAQHIPKGSKVVGEPLYYYAVVKNGSNYQYYNLYNELDIRERLHREEYDYDYLIVTDHHQMRDYDGVIDYYKSKANLKKVAEIHTPQSEWAVKISNLNILGFPLLSNVERYGFGCVIYKRVREAVY